MSGSYLPIAPDQPWLAPMAGFSDLPFRLLCRELGCSAACTEMVSAKGLVLGQASWRLLKTCELDAPLVVQVFGGEKKFIRQALTMLLDTGFCYFDLNAGCAVRKVTKTGAGAALLQEPSRLVDLVGEMSSLAGPGRVGVKLRTGWETGQKTILGLARELESLGLGWITLHPRSAKQGFTGYADWSLLKELQTSVALPVLGSGDLFSAWQGRQCLEQTGIQGVMFARGALSNPGIFLELKDILYKGQDFKQPSRQEPAVRLQKLQRIMLRHIQLCKEYAQNPGSFLKMRTVLPKYLKGVHQARMLRSRIVTCRDWGELQSLVQGNRDGILFAN